MGPGDNPILIRFPFWIQIVSRVYSLNYFNSHSDGQGPFYEKYVH